jgi:hypothetical protein
VEALPKNSSPPLDPSSRLLLRLAGLLGVLVILVALNSLLRDGGDSPFSPNPIAAAAERASAEPGGARMTMEASYVFAGGQTMKMSGAGAFDPLAESALMRMTMLVPAPLGSVDFDVIVAGGHGYLRSSVFAGSLPAGKEWIGLDASDLDASGETMAGTDPSDQLQLLREVGGSVATLGRERVGGAITTRYRGAIPVSAFTEEMRDRGQDEAADALEQSGGTVTAEAWIDDAGRIRQMRIVMGIAALEGAPPLSMEMTMEFFDFGSHPAIAPPPASAVLEADDAGIDPSLLSGG